MAQLALQRLGEGRYPHRAIGLLGPERSGGEIAERLADPRTGLGEHHVGCAMRHARAERLARGLGIGALARALLGGAPGEPREPRLGLVGIERYGARLWARRAFGPFAEFREQPAFGDVGGLEPLRKDRRPSPAQFEQRLRRGPCALALGPVGAGLGHAEQRHRGVAQEGGDLTVLARSFQPCNAR